MENFHLSWCLPSCIRKRRISKSLETFTNGEGTHLNLCNNHTLVYCAFPGNLYQRPSPTSSSFVFSWRWYLRWWLWLFQRVTLFSWVSPMYTGGIRSIKLCFSCSNLSYMNLINIPAKEPRKEEEKFSPTFSWQLEERKQKNIAVSCMPSLVIKLSLGSVHKLVCTLELWLNIFSGIQEGSQGTEKATVMCRFGVDIFSLREQ